MAFYGYQETFAGYRAQEWEAKNPLENLHNTAYRIALEYEDELSFADKLQQYLADPRAVETEALIVGQWHAEAFEQNSSEAATALIEAAAKLPKLHSIFFGDITIEECEVSWLQNIDVSPLMNAYPALRHFTVRGGEGLLFSALTSPNLTHLIVQSGGLDSTTVQQIAQANLPKLQQLELYLGVEDYGASYTIEDLQPIMEGKNLPALRYLGLKNAEDQDAITDAVLSSAILPQLEVLDLSMGTLSDEGGEKICHAIDAIRHLKKLDLHHHYLSDEMIDKIKKLGIADVDISEQEEIEDDWRFVAIGE